MCLADRTWFPHNMFIVLTWDALVQAYETYCKSTLPHPCPHCHRSRRYAGGHWRWVLWAAGTRRHFWLRHVRCETCHTLETLFPPWLLPYEEWTLMVLQQALDAALDAGRSFAGVAAEWGVDREAVVRRVARWREQAPALRQIVAQKAAAWEAAPPGSTWQPRPQCIWPNRNGQFGHRFSPLWPLRIPHFSHWELPLSSPFSDD